MSSENVTCVSEIISQLKSHYAGKLMKLMCSKYSGTELIVIGRPENLSSPLFVDTTAKLMQVISRRRKEEDNML